MAAFDWRNSVFQGSGQIMGLSGGGGSAVALDDRNSFYNFRLRRHYTDDDISDEPHRLWFTNDDRDARTGLGPHVADVLTDGQRFTDVLIILSEDDHEEAFDHGTGFQAKVEQVVRKQFEEFLSKSAMRPSPRPLGLWIVKDGAKELGGHEFGLVEGEFITGIMPNLYRGPGPASKPILKLMVNIPGEWEGYREVGRLFDDQVLFTVGSHWLDNFQHPAVRESALYRLQREDEGGFFHIVNPDLQDRYRITSTDQGGTSVITLASVDGDPLAYIVLAVVEEDDADLDPFAEANTPEVAAPAIVESDLTYRPPSLEPAAMPQAPRSRGSKTIIPEAQSERIFTLQERGALLQKVHFSAFMLGYDVYLGFRGELGTVVDNVAATFQVRKKTVSLLANADSVMMDGEPIPQGESRLIEGDAVIQVGNQRLDYRDLRHIDMEGWPYVGEIRRPASSTYMLWGREYTIGRSRDSRVVLPDEPRNDNIVWKPKIGDGSTIKSKTGEIPKSRFYTDSIMVASEHAAIELLDDDPYLSCHARHCYTFVRRHDEVLPLYPATSEEGPHRFKLEPGDEVLIGNCLFHTGFAGSENAGVVAPAPAPRVSSDSLVDAVSSPEFAAAKSVPAADPDDDFGINLPSGVDESEPPPAPRVEPAAEASLRAPQRSWPEAEADLADAADAPEPVTQRSTPAAPKPSPPAKAAAPAPAPEPTPAAPAASAPPVSGDVVVVDDQDAQFELGRPARLVQVGWMVNGTVTCGNTAGSDLVVPENRIDEDQRFTPQAYFELKIRGKRGSLTVTSPSEVRVDGQAPQGSYDDCNGLQISVLRRDEEGEVDFEVGLKVAEDAALPDPRARLLALDTDEPLSTALFTRGFPVRAPRTLEINGLELTGTFDGSKLLLSDYLASYRSDAGFKAFFVQTGGGRFVTAPEDGSGLELARGDRLIVEGAVYRFDVT